MAQKFIINDGILILGHVDLHEQLLRGSLERNKTVGGGYWFKENRTGTLYFYGKSIDFGKVSEEQFETSIKSAFVLVAPKIVFSLEDSLEAVLSAESVKEEKLLNKNNGDDK